MLKLYALDPQNSVQNLMALQNCGMAQNYRWLDFSGAPPLLIAAHIAKYWRGTTDRKSGAYSDPDFEQLVTDYDRCVQVAVDGNGTLDFCGTSVLVLYTEYDLHTWVDEYKLIFCSGSVPSPDKLNAMKWGAPTELWGEPVRWFARDEKYYLMNSAADAGAGLNDEDFLLMTLRPGRCLVKSCHLDDDDSGIYHRLFYEEEPKEEADPCPRSQSERSMDGSQDKAAR